MIENVPRWVHASIKAYIKHKWTHPLIVEGEDSRDSKVPAYAELRIDGPTLTPFGTKGNYKATVEINFLITCQKDQKYVHKLQDLMGQALKVLQDCIPIKKIGSTFEQDDGSLVGILQTVEEVDITNFGQVEVTVTTQQASVERSYQAILEL